MNKSVGRMERYTVLSSIFTMTHLRLIEIFFSSLAQQRWSRYNLISFKISNSFIVLWHGSYFTRINEWCEKWNNWSYFFRFTARHSANAKVSVRKIFRKYERCINAIKSRNDLFTIPTTIKKYNRVSYECIIIIFFKFHVILHNFYYVKKKKKTEKKNRAYK